MSIARETFVIKRMAWTKVLSGILDGEQRVGTRECDRQVASSALFEKINKCLQILWKKSIFLTKNTLYSYRKNTRGTTMAVNTIQELIQYVKTLPLSVQSKVYAQYNLDKIDVFTAGMLLKKLQYENHTNPIKESVNERMAMLEQRKEKATAIWEQRRKEYYDLANLAAQKGTEENIKNKEDAFLKMQLAGEHMVDATKMANNTYIQTYLA